MLHKEGLMVRHHHRTLVPVKYMFRTIIGVAEEAQLGDIISHDLLAIVLTGIATIAIIPDMIHGSAASLPSFRRRITLLFLIHKSMEIHLLWSTLRPPPQ